MLMESTAVEEESNDVNLTPMLDVVFILLIFFVVTATFTRDFGLQVGLPNTNQADTQNVSAIVVRVEEGGSFSVNGRALSPGSLAPYIVSLRTENPDASFLVEVADAAIVDDTVKAVDAARAAGYRKVPIARIEE